MALHPPSTRPVKEPDAEPIPGYRLIEPLGKGGFGEVWKCEAPGGLHKAIKFVQGESDHLSNEPCASDQELRALQHVKSIRHPFLLSMDRVEHVGGELLIVMELADRSLHDLLVECRAAGAPGIPRTDLLLYLREAAEVLDLMNQEYGLQHLDIKPRNLFLVHQHVKVADFGLVNSLAELNGQDQAQFQLGAITPLYAAPETFLGKITLFSDQYSLAIVYCELLTGQLPLNGKNFRQLALQHTSGKPDLTLLGLGDQPIVAKALAKDPRQRYSSCIEFVRALIAVPEEDLVRQAAETREAKAASSATMHDIDVVDKKKTAAIARPTMVLRAEAARPAIDAMPSEDANLDGFHFLDCLGRTPLGELWRTETPAGQLCLVKLVNTFNPGMGEENAAAQLRAIRHRRLLAAKIQAHTMNRLAIITAPVKECLATRLQEYQNRGRPGIPRLELLGYLLNAAETLDELQHLYGLQHLGVNPRNLMLVNGELQVSDFGLVALLWLPGGQQPAQINPRYSAPELFQRRLSKHCDQYSLGLIFYELLTGDQVHGNRTPSQHARSRSAALDYLDLLPAPDRPILGRALHPEVDKRYPSSTEFIRALLENTPGGEELLDRDSHPEIQQGSGVLVPVRVPARAEAPVDRELAARCIFDIVNELAGSKQLREVRSAQYVYRPGVEMEHRCYARLVPGTLRLKLAGFIEQWRAIFVSEEENHFLFRMRLQSSLWKRMLGGQPGLDIEVTAHPPAVPGASLTEVCLQLRPVGCGRDEGTMSLEKWGPQLIDSLRTHLQVGPERRKHPRFPFERRIACRPLFAANRVGDVIECETRDISMEGIGLSLAVEPPSQMLLEFCRVEGGTEVNIPGQVVRAQPCADGRFDVGVRFAT